MTKPVEPSAPREQFYGGTCPECDGTGNFYRADEDGDYLPCDACNGTGDTPEVKL